MKIIIIIIIVFANFILSFSLNAQTYRKLFDNLDQSGFFKNGGYSYYSNFKSQLHNDESIIMRAYINMYKATEDIKYLNEFIIHAKRVMDRRDNRIASANPVTELPLIDYKGCSSIGKNSTQLQGKVCWSRVEPNCVLYPHFMETGTITFPMAEFIMLTRDNTSLNSNPLPTEAISSGINNFGDFANWLKINVHQSLIWHINNDWNSDLGRFVTSTDNSLNQQCAISSR